MDSNPYQTQLINHCSQFWGRCTAVRWHTGGRTLPRQCSVLEFAPSVHSFSWIYATCGMSPTNSTAPIELYLMAPQSCVGHVELLTAVAHYHQTENSIQLGDTVDFGRPWIDGSSCNYGLISLPYAYGPILERPIVFGVSIRILWLVPITIKERQYKMQYGLEALEHAFEMSQFDYLSPVRDSVV